MKNRLLGLPVSALVIVAMSLPLFGFTCGEGPVSIGSEDAGADGGTIPCTATSDCASGQLCAFAIGTCASQGVCIPGPTGATCESLTLACGCDGTQVDVPCWYRSGYAPAPVQTLSGGSCTARDAGPPTACHSDSDCGTNQACGYPIADACAATGVCIDLPTGARCESVTAVCGCDGTEAGIPCFWPSGYATAPTTGTRLPCGSDGG